MRIWNQAFFCCFFPMLVACPVGPDAVKTADEEGPSEPILTAPSEGGQMKSPDGTPPNMGGNNMNTDPGLAMGGNNSNAIPNPMGDAGNSGSVGEMGGQQIPQGDAQANMGMGTEMVQGGQGGMGDQGMGEQGMGEQGMGDQGMGMQGNMGQNGQMGQDDQINQGNQMGDGENQGGAQQVSGGELSGDVIPMYSKAPVFDDIIGQGESITIQLSVSAAQEVERFNCEFIVAQTIGSRVAPKVLHMEQVTGSRTSIIAPKNYEEDVYVVITYDVNDDGPGDDDLLGGSKGVLKLGAEDLTLNYELSSDDSWMEELPWYTRVGTVQTPNGTGSPN